MSKTRRLIVPAVFAGSPVALLLMAVLVNQGGMHGGLAAGVAFVAGTAAALLVLRKI